MTVKELAEKLNLKELCCGDLTKQVKGGYCGDLLSWVMGRANAGDCWFTVMGNVNAVAVAVLADCACIVLVEDAVLDEAARAKAELQGVNIFTTDESSFEMAKRLGEIL